MFRSCVKRKGIVPQIENMIIQKVDFLGFRLLDTNHVSNYIAMRFLLTEPEIEHQDWSKCHYGKSHGPVGHLLSDPGVRILPSMKQMHKHEAELCWAPLERKTMIQTLRFLKRLNCYSGIRVAVSSSWLFQWFARVISCLTTGFSYYWHRGQSIATILPKMWLYLQKFLFDGVVWSFMFGIKNACWTLDYTRTGYTRCIHNVGPQRYKLVLVYIQSHLTIVITCYITTTINR